MAPGAQLRKDGGVGFSRQRKYSVLYYCLVSELLSFRCTLCDHILLVVWSNFALGLHEDLQLWMVGIIANDDKVLNNFPHI